MVNELEQSVLKKAQSWLDGHYDDPTKKQVKYLIDNDMKELVESFYKDLEFGTGGLRGVMGVGHFAAGLAVDDEVQPIHHRDAHRERARHHPHARTRRLPRRLHGLHQQISPLAAIHSRLAAAGTPDALSVVNPGRDRHLDLLLAGCISGSGTGCTFFLDHLAGTAAGRTGLYILYGSEKGLGGIDDLALAAAF